MQRHYDNHIRTKHSNQSSNSSDSNSAESNQNSNASISSNNQQHTAATVHTIPCSDCNQQIPVSQYNSHRLQHIPDTTSSTSNVQIARNVESSSSQSNRNSNDSIPSNNQQIAVSQSSPKNHNDDDLEVLSSPSPKKRRISVESPKRNDISDVINVNPVNQDEAANVTLLQDMFDIQAPIKIGAVHYRLRLLYDTEMKRIMERFTGYSLEKRLVHGDCCWSLINEEGNEWIYPLIIHIKGKADLLGNMKNGKCREQNQQKMRMKQMKQNLPHFRQLYLVKEFEVNQRDEKKLLQALVSTEIDDGVQIQWASREEDTVQMLTQWTLIVYQQIKEMSMQCTVQCDLFQKMECVRWKDFNAKMDDKEKSKGIEAKEWFKRTLMLIHGVDETIASLISARYPTIRRLVDAWNHHDDVKGRERMLYNLEGNEWIKCRIDGHFVGEVEDCVLAELDRIGERPICETLSAKLYNYFVM